MCLEQDRSRFFFKECSLFSGARLHEVHQTLEQTDRGNFIDDKETFPVSHLIDLLAVRIVGGAEGVGADPFHQLKISLHHTDIESAADNVAVFVLPESSEIYRFPVYQDICAFYFHGTDADVLSVFVEDLAFVHDTDHHMVQISIPYFPQMSVLYFQNTFFSFAVRHLFSFFIQQFYSYRMISGRLYCIGYLCIRTAQFVDSINVKNGFLWKRRQPDGPLQTGIVEEIKVRLAHFLSRRKGNGLTAGDVCLSQFVVDLDYHFVICVVMDKISYIRTEREKSALMFRSIDPVYIYGCAVGCGAETDENLFPFPLARNEDLLLIPEISRILPDVFVRVKVLKTCGYGDHILSGDPFLPVVIFSI